MVGPAGAIVWLLLVITQSGTCQSQLKVFTSSTFNISGHVSDGELVGNVNISKANGDVYTGRVVNTELGIQAKGRGVIVYGINGLVYEGDFDNGDPNGRGLVRMPLQSSLESSSLTECSGCRQEMDDSGKWWLIVEGDAKSTGNGWIIVSQTVEDSISQHAAIVNINDGRYGVGQMINGRMEGSGFLKVFHKIYQYNGPLHQKCTDIEEHPDEKRLSSNFTADMISYWTNMKSYEGEFSSGNPHGVGKMSLGTGEVIEGHFYQGKPVCYGKITFNNIEECKKVSIKAKIMSECNTCFGDKPKLETFFVGGIPGMWKPVNASESGLELKIFTYVDFNISSCLHNGELVGNVTISKASGDIFVGKVVKTEQGIQAKGHGVLVYGINGLIYEGNFENGDPNGRGLIRMPLASPLDSSLVDGCSGCRQEMGVHGEWWLIVEGNTKSTGKGWISLSQAVKNNISQLTVAINIKDGRYAFGLVFNGRMEGKGFLRVFHKIYPYTGPLYQKCLDLTEELDEESLSSNFTEDMISYWTNMESYEGEFSNGNPHGVGKMRLGTGEVIKGRFYEGKPVCYGNVAFQTVETCSKVLKKILSHRAICTEDQLVFKAFFVGGIPGLWLPPVNVDLLHLPQTGEWNLVFRQTFELGHLFSSGQWSKGDISQRTFSNLQDLEKYRRIDGSFHFFLWYPELGKGNEWIQTSNPVTKTSDGVDGYQALDISFETQHWGGLEYNNEVSLLDGSSNHSNWYYAIGSFINYHGGMPGPNGVVKKVELYVDAIEQPNLPAQGEWITIFRQSMLGNFFAAGEWKKGDISQPNFSNLQELEQYRRADGSFHFFLWYPELGKGNEWIQTSNPVTKTSGGVDGYQALDISFEANHWGGLEYNDCASLLDGSASHPYLYYAIGSFNDYHGGIPGPNGVIRKAELYVDANGCGEVPEVLHSTATFSANDTVKYACERGFTMVGHHTVACKEGMWSPQPPSCHQRPPSICDSSPCHPTALCSPITSGYKCQCKDEEEGDPYFAGCHSTTRFTDVISAASRSTCGYKPASSTTNHIQCGGSVSALEAPWQVSIVSVKSLQRIHWCGGVLVSLTHVLSSAHCFQSAQCNILSRLANNKCNKSLFLAFFGRSNATILHPDDMFLDDVNSVHREIEEVYLHPDWQYANPVSNGNDISIFTVKAVPINAFIKPACLPNPSSHFFLHQELNGHMEITGFGRNGSFNVPLRTSTPHQLQLVDMKIIDKLVCDSKLTGQVAPDVFCAVPGNDEKGVCMGKPGTCEGDSGGPAVVKDTLGQYIVIGLVSGGPPCGEDESVHPHRLTSVSHHLSFIMDHMEALPCPPPVGAPTSPTCSLSFAQFVSDLPCYDKTDCPAGGRCLDYSCTLFQDDDDAEIARTQCVSSQQCRDGAFMCDAITRRCRPDKAGNGTDIQVSGGVRTLFVPKTSSLGSASLPKRKRSSCGGYYPCPVRTTDGRRACKSAYCNQFRRCWCPYPVSLLLDTKSGKFVDPE